MEKIDYLDYINQLSQNGYQIVIQKKVVDFEQRYDKSEGRYFSLLYNEEYGVLLCANSYVLKNTHILNSVIQNVAYLSEGREGYLNYNSMKVRANFEYPSIYYITTNDTDPNYFNQKVFEKVKLVKTADNFYANHLYLNKELIFNAEDYNLVKDVVSSSNSSVENINIKTKMLYNKSLRNISNQYDSFVQQLPPEVQQSFIEKKNENLVSFGLLKYQKERTIRMSENDYISMDNRTGQVVSEIMNSLLKKVNLKEYRETMNGFKVLMLASQRKEISKYLKEKGIDKIVNKKIKNSYLDIFFLNTLIDKKEIKQFIIKSIDKHCLQQKFATIIQKNTNKKTKIQLNYFENIIVGEQYYTQVKNIYLKEIIKVHKEVIEEHLRKYPLTVKVLDYVKEVNQYGFIQENFIKHLQLFEKYKINYYGDNKEKFLDSLLDHSLLSQESQETIISMKIAHEKEILSRQLKLNTSNIKINKI